jgi:hypothetical protein
MPVKKKNLWKAAFIMTLLLSVIAGAEFSNFGKAVLLGQGRRIGEISPEEVGAEPPVITISYPQNSSVTNQDIVPFSFSTVLGYTAQPTARFMKRVYYRADWLPENNYTYIFDYIERPSTLNLTGINGTPIPEGKHNVTVTALQEGQYIADMVIENGFSHDLYYVFNIEGSSIVFFTVDRTSPIVSVLSTENKTYGTNEIPLNFTVNESVSELKYSLDGLNSVTVVGNTTLTELPNGNHNVTVYAIDEAGNTGTSETVYFNVEVPFPTMLFIAPIATVAAIGVGLLVYSKKRKEGKNS